MSSKGCRPCLAFLSESSTSIADYPDSVDGVHRDSSELRRPALYSIDNIDAVPRSYDNPIDTTSIVNNDHFHSEEVLEVSSTGKSPEYLKDLSGKTTVTYKQSFEVDADQASEGVTTPVENPTQIPPQQWQSSPQSAATNVYNFKITERELTNDDMSSSYASPYSMTNQGIGIMSSVSSYGGANLEISEESIHDGLGFKVSTKEVAASISTTGTFEQLYEQSANQNHGTLEADDQVSMGPLDFSNNYSPCSVARGDVTEIQGLNTLLNEHTYAQDYFKPTGNLNENVTFNAHYNTYDNYKCGDEDIEDFPPTVVPTRRNTEAFVLSYSDEQQQQQQKQRHPSAGLDDEDHKYIIMQMEKLAKNNKDQETNSPFRKLIKSRNSPKTRSFSTNSFNDLKLTKRKTNPTTRSSTNIFKPLSISRSKSTTQISNNINDNNTSTTIIHFANRGLEEINENERPDLKSSNSTGSNNSNNKKHFRRHQFWFERKPSWNVYGLLRNRHSEKVSLR